MDVANIPLLSAVAKNPEFRRNVWIEMNIGRVAGLTVIVVTIALLFITFEDRATAVFTAAMVLYTILVNFWGTKLAIDSIIDEVNGRTWISQQMTPLSPWKMAWGKLFGSTIFAWYGGALCLMIMLLASPFSDSPLATFPRDLPYTVLNSITFHASGMILALVSIRRLPTGQKLRPAGVYLITLMGIWATLGYLPVFNRMAMVTNYNSTEYMYWGISTSPAVVLLLQSFFWCAWSLVGLRQAMRTELQFVNDLKLWYWFLASMTVLLLGFVEPEQAQLATYTLSAALIAVSVTGLLALLEPKVEMEFRRVIRAWNSGDWRTVQGSMPLWAASLPVALGLCAIAAVVALASQGESTSSSGEWLSSLNPAFPLALACYLVRDIAIILWINFTRSKRPDTTALVVLALIHILIPTILAVPSDSITVVGIFNPLPTEGAALSFVSGAVQAMIAVGILLKVWKGR